MPSITRKTINLTIGVTYFDSFYLHPLEAPTLISSTGHNFQLDGRKKNHFSHERFLKAAASSCLPGAHFKLDIW